MTATRDCKPTRPDSSTDSLWRAMKRHDAYMEKLKVKVEHEGASGHRTLLWHTVYQSLHAALRDPVYSFEDQFLEYVSVLNTSVPIPDDVDGRGELWDWLHQQIDAPPEDETLGDRDRWKRDFIRYGRMLKHWSVELETAAFELIEEPARDGSGPAWGTLKQANVREELRAMPYYCQVKIIKALTEGLSHSNRGKLFLADQVRRSFNPDLDDPVFDVKYLLRPTETSSYLENSVYDPAQHFDDDGTVEPPTDSSPPVHDTLVKNLTQLALNFGPALAVRLKIAGVEGVGPGRGTEYLDEMSKATKWILQTFFSADQLARLEDDVGSIDWAVFDEETRVERPGGGLDQAASTANLRHKQENHRKVAAGLAKNFGQVLSVAPGPGGQLMGGLMTVVAIATEFASTGDDEGPDRMASLTMVNSTLNVGAALAETVEARAARRAVQAEAAGAGVRHSFAARAAIVRKFLEPALKVMGPVMDAISVITSTVDAVKHWEEGYDGVAVGHTIAAIGGGMSLLGLGFSAIATSHTAAAAAGIGISAETMTAMGAAAFTGWAVAAAVITVVAVALGLLAALVIADFTLSKMSEWLTNTIFGRRWDEAQRGESPADYDDPEQVQFRFEVDGEPNVARQIAAYHSLTVPLDLARPRIEFVSLDGDHYFTGRVEFGVKRTDDDGGTLDAYRDQLDAIAVSVHGQHYGELSEEDQAKVRRWIPAQDLSRYSVVQIRPIAKGLDSHTYGRVQHEVMLGDRTNQDGSPAGRGGDGPTWPTNVPKRNPVGKPWGTDPPGDVVLNVVDPVNPVNDSGGSPDQSYWFAYLDGRPRGTRPSDARRRSESPVAEDVFGLEGRELVKEVRSPSGGGGPGITEDTEFEARDDRYLEVDVLTYRSYQTLQRARRIARRNGLPEPSADNLPVLRRERKAIRVEEANDTVTELSSIPPDGGGG